MLIGYARVSTLDQNLNLQLDALKAAGCEKIFTDKLSGAKNDRAGLAEALSHARDGDTILVWKLDRFGRSLQHLVSSVQELQSRGVGFRSLKESIDTTTSTGKLIFHIFAALAEFERDVIRERTRAGMDAAKVRGGKSGRKPKVDAAKIETARILLEHQSGREVAKQLNISERTLRRHLSES